MQGSLTNRNSSSPPPSDSKIQNTKKSTPFLFNHKHYLRSLRASATPITETKEISEETQLLLESICAKFSFTD